MNAPHDAAPHDAADLSYARPPGRYIDDLRAGFLVSLIALPLSLGIAIASGYPPIAGLITAILGGLVATWMGSSPLTIKGPAAGLIVLCLGAVTELGAGDPALGYRRALAVGVVAALVQITLALLRTGKLGEIFPPSVVHGMMAAIGVMIVARQSHVMLGASPQASSPLGLLAQLPHSALTLNPEIALIGALSLALLMALPKAKLALARKLPGPMLVLAAAIPLGLAFDLSHEHTYTLASHTFTVGPKHLVQLSGDLLSALTWPDFSVITSPTSLKYVAMFALVGSVESLLSAKAVDLMDPWRRGSDMDRDLLAVGVGNLLSACLGGLPMISEIVRSRANIDSGAYSRRANLAHGACLLGIVVLLPGLLQRVPMSALAAMLVFTGLRLASPQELRHSWRVGKDQCALFLTTLGVTLMTDLLLGVACGMALKLVLHLMRHHDDLGGLLRVRAREELADDGQLVITILGPAIFLNTLSLRRRLLDHVAAGATALRVELSQSPLVDHTTQERLHDLRYALQARGVSLTITGLEHMRAVSAHPLATRQRALPATPSSCCTETPR